MNDHYPRQWVGYGKQPPKVKWPNNARIAINFVVNYEEGAEQNILDGSATSENYLTEIPNLQALKNERHFSAESSFAYGSRVGIWRLLNLFNNYQTPITLFAAGLALERNLSLCDFLKNTPHEIAGHGYQWRDYRYISRDEEKQHVLKTLKNIKELTHKNPVGWYTGRKSAHTRALVIEAGLLYDSEDYSDDLPFYVNINEKHHLVIPYTLDCNDCKYLSSPGWATPHDFFNYLKNNFDYLYEEGKSTPKMMTVALHARISGKPARAMAIKLFLEYIKSQKHCWLTTREAIAYHWLQQNPI